MQERKNSINNCNNKGVEFVKMAKVFINFNHILLYF